jgi:hypothetical protein
MAKNANVLIIRHGEKPASGTGLTVAGQERAQAYIVYFQNYPANGTPLKLNYLFAAADSNDSHRPRLTIEPLSKAIGVSIDASHKDKDYKKVADDIKGHSKYDNGNILICWHHEEILDFANKLGVDPSKLPATADWPASWPGSVYGWLLQISFDGNGNVQPSQTFCISEALMHDDTEAPPG